MAMIRRNHDFYTQYLYMHSWSQLQKHANKIYFQKNWISKQLWKIKINFK